MCMYPCCSVVVRKYDTSNPPVQTWAKDWAFRVSTGNADAIAVGPSGEVAIVGGDTEEAIAVYSSSGVPTWTLEAPALTTEPSACAFDSNGYLWANGITGVAAKKYDTDGTLLVTTSGGVYAAVIFVDGSDNILTAAVAGPTSGNIYKHNGSTGAEITTGGFPINVASDSGAAACIINAIVVDSSGNIYCCVHAYAGNGATPGVYKYDSAGNYDSMAAWTDSTTSLRDLAINASNDVFACGNFGTTARVEAYSGGNLGSVAWTHDKSTSTNLFSKVAPHSDGGCYAIDTTTDELVRISSGGSQTYRQAWSSEGKNANDVAVDASNNPHVCGQRTKRAV